MHFPLRVDAEAIRVLYLEGFLREENQPFHDFQQSDEATNCVQAWLRVMGRVVEAPDRRTRIGRPTANETKLRS